MFPSRSVLALSLIRVSGVTRKMEFKLNYFKSFNPWPIFKTEFFFPFPTPTQLSPGHLKLYSDLETEKKGTGDFFFDSYILKIERIHAYSSPDYSKWREVSLILPLSTMSPHSSLCVVFLSYPSSLTLVPLA
jgi:hypothetical protein